MDKIIERLNKELELIENQIDDKGFTKEKLENKIEYSIVPSATWRSYCKITGKTRTDKKRSCQLKIKEWYKISVSEDEADAICIGRYGTNLVSKQYIMAF